MSLHADIVKILNDEGAASEGGWHSWRCFDKDRYPEPCECTEVVASMVMSAALDAAREAVAAALVKGLATSTDGALYFFELGGDPDFPNNGYDVTFRKDSLIAAIDALRTKP